MNCNYKYLPRRLALAREIRGLELEQIADIMQVDTNTVRRWENGRIILKTPTFLKLINIYNLFPIEWYLS